MKITLRDLFWLILVAAIALGWFVDHRMQREQISRMMTPWQAMHGMFEPESLDAK